MPSDFVRAGVRGGARDDRGFPQVILSTERDFRDLFRVAARTGEFLNVLEFIIIGFSIRRVIFFSPTPLPERAPNPGSNDIVRKEGDFYKLPAVY